ncbi:probable phosphatase phospho1 isoform X3 [Bacillus rossius redtenbacheri]|uniref:probable phosphatase phospho1 isoform X3 n=1 Tax=Bacillus rossius redtenbacheri TaxID=93214 RepID=UPI002FDD0F08
MLMQKPFLFAFDFDHTIVDDNTDTVARDLVPREKIPKHVEELYAVDGWTTYMGEVFKILHASSITPAQIKAAVRAIPAVPHLDDLLRYLRENDCEVVVISDSNSVFIEEWLRGSSLDATVRRVFTNPAHFSEDGLLHISMHHLQDWCKLSSKNLCKGHILERYIEGRRAEGVSFPRVSYVGDGRNDLCPSLRLSADDLVFPRIGFALHKAIEKQEAALEASVHPWRDGSDIMNVVSQILK